MGEQAIDRIACALGLISFLYLSFLVTILIFIWSGLGGKTVIPYVFSVISSMIQNPDWKHRHAALMTISAIGEGCHKQMEKELDKILA